MQASIAHMALESLKESHPEIADCILSAVVNLGVVQINYKSGVTKRLGIESGRQGRHAKTAAICRTLIQLGPL